MSRRLIYVLTWSLFTSLLGPRSAGLPITQAAAAGLLPRDPHLGAFQGPGLSGPRLSSLRHPQPRFSGSGVIQGGLSDLAEGLPATSSCHPHVGGACPGASGEGWGAAIPSVEGKEAGVVVVSAHESDFCFSNRALPGVLAHQGTRACPLASSGEAAF